MADSALEREHRGEVAQVDKERGLTLTPRVDILETDDELLLHVDLPGVKPDGLDIRFENGELFLHGRRAQRRTGKPWLWEYETASFQRTFRVAENIAADKISAELKNGVLTVHLPKAEAVKPKKIAVKGK